MLLLICLLAEKFEFVFELVQPLSDELNSQIQLNFIGLSNEAREPARGNGSGQSVRIIIISVSLCL